MGNISIKLISTKTNTQFPNRPCSPKLFIGMESRRLIIEDVEVRIRRTEIPFPICLAYAQDHQADGGGGDRHNGRHQTAQNGPCMNRSEQLFSREKGADSSN